MKKRFSHLRKQMIFLLILALSGISSVNLTAQNIAEDGNQEAAQKPMDPREAVSAEYHALWNDDINREIDERIEKYRKADVSFTLEDAAFREVKIAQRTHEFQFGAQIFNFNQLGSDELNAKYLSLYGEDKFFNAATLPFYWSGIEPEEGKTRFEAEYCDSAEYWNQVKEPTKEPHWRRPCPEPIIKFCQENGISMHGHPIIYCRIFPKWLQEWDPARKDELEKKYADHTRRIVERYQGQLDSWDVVNESVEPTPGKKRYPLTPDDYTFKTWEIAQNGFPKDVLLSINDSWRAVYPPFIRELIDRGAKIDVVGLQMHIFGSKPILDIAAGKDCVTNGTSWKPRDVEAYLRELDKLERPIHLSEITIPAPGTDPRSEAIQAQVTRDMYRLWFSWPSIYRITWWNVVDGCGYAGEPTKSGFFTRDMKPKPVYWALKQLIDHEWKTNLTLKADENGTISFRGFRGKYVLSWTDSNGKERAQEVTVR